ncbi:hypothetical protein ASF70_17685 [Rhizobium sp. Leaf321]|nr:hypothetical protein ASF70_17685 [Rhizobium sp. Leaf321]
MFNLMMSQIGEGIESPGDAARIDRWLLEAKEHHPWFVRALAEFAVSNAGREGETMETILLATWEMYFIITTRNPEQYYDELAPGLYIDMLRIGDKAFQEELMAWLKEH